MKRLERKPVEKRKKRPALSKHGVPGKFYNANFIAPPGSRGRYKYKIVHVCVE